VRASARDLNSSRAYGQQVIDVRRQNPSNNSKRPESIYNSMVIESSSKRSTSAKRNTSQSNHSHYKSVTDASIVSQKESLFKQQTFDSSRNNLIIKEVTLGAKKRQITIKGQ